MKHLKTFENFVETNTNPDVNEWLGQKFLTGHGPGEKEEAVTRINSEIEAAIQEYKKNPQEFLNVKENILRDKLLKAAKENGYRGQVVVRKSTGDPRSTNSGKKFIVYVPKASGLQDVGSGAASGTRVMGNF